MSKLFKLKEWLTLDEAVVHISNVLGEPATVADLYRFALEGHLTLSVNFVNSALVRKGRWSNYNDPENFDIEYDDFTGEELERRPKYSPTEFRELAIVRLELTAQTIKGVWDLTMYGTEKLEIERHLGLAFGFEPLTIGISGALVQRGDVVCMLQRDIVRNREEAYEEAMKDNLATSDAIEGEVDEFDAKTKLYRSEMLSSFMEDTLDGKHISSRGLSENDHILVIRTNEIIRFIQSLEETPAPEKPLTTNERNSLLVLIGALCKEVDIDPNQRGVAASLVAMTEMNGASLTDDTIRKILGQIEGAVSLRSK